MTRWESVQEEKIRASRFLERVWSRAILDEDEAMALALEAQRAVRD